MKVALIGFNDLGLQIKEILLEHYSLSEEEFIYFDDNHYESGTPNSFPFKSFIEPQFANYDFYVCLGYKYLSLKNKIIHELINLHRVLPNFVHPAAYVHPSVQIGEGTFISASCSIDRNTNIGRGVWMVNAVTIAHDCTIEDVCWLGPGVTLSGKVSVSKETFIGSGTTISNGIRIGENVIVGLGTVVTANIENNASIIGSPMRVLNKKINLH